MNRRYIHILQMDQHFLYLPIYFARDNNFFGFLPKDVKVEILISNPKTDRGAFAQLMDDDDVKNRPYVMAITDPTQVLQNNISGECQPVVLAAMVTNGAFWAVNHGTRSISALRQLGEFSRILAFPPGTTSYTVASRIARESGKGSDLDSFIRVVEPGKELLCLNDVSTPLNEVALSPDLLKIESMLSQNTASIELALGNTPEFNDVLVTTLISRSDFVRDNSDIVEGILAGIQKALIMIRLDREEVIAFAQVYFQSHDYARSAIDRAVSAGVFPISIVIEKPHWQHTARAFFESQKPGHTWETAQEQKSLEYFDMYVKPQVAIAERAAKQILSPRSEVLKKPIVSPFILLVIAVLSAFVTVYVGLQITLILIIVCTIIRWLFQKQFLKANPFLYWIAIPLIVLGSTLLVIKYFNLTNSAFSPYYEGQGLSIFYLGLSLIANDLLAKKGSRQ